MDAGLIILYLIELVIVLVFGVVIFFKKRELDDLDETCRYLRIKALSNEPINREAIMKVLQEEGLVPTICEEGDIEFKINGTTLNITEGAKGLCSIRVFYSIEKDLFWKGLYAANIVNQTIVVVKTLLIEENETLIFSVESYCKTVESFREQFHTSLNILNYSIEQFREEMDKLSEPQTDKQGVRNTSMAATKESTIPS